MSKHRSSAVLITMIAILILSAIQSMLSSCERRKETNSLDYQKYPINIYGKLTYDKKEYIISANIKDEKNISIIFDSPFEMEGVEFLLSDGMPEIAYGDIKIPINDTDYILSNSILSLIKIFSLDQERISDISLEEINGVTYNISKYSYDGYKVSVYTLKGNPTPVMFKLLSESHELIFEVLPDKAQN